MDKHMVGSEIDVLRAIDNAKIWLAQYEQNLGSPTLVIEESIREEPWGWVIFWEPSDPDLIPPELAEWGFMPVIVLRENGDVLPVSTAGVTATISQYFWSREENPGT